MKEPILKAATQVLIRKGLNNWTVEEVAKQAGCAKGLVNYHHRSKEQLLRQVAQTLREDRWKKRLAAVAVPGTAALDQLWSVLVEEVSSGRFAGWLTLLAAGGSLRQSAMAEPNAPADLTATLARSLGLPDRLRANPGMVEAALDGVELRLLEGVPPGEAEEAYHQFWLAALEM